MDDRERSRAFLLIVAIVGFGLLLSPLSAEALGEGTAGETSSWWHSLSSTFSAWISPISNLFQSLPPTPPASAPSPDYETDSAERVGVTPSRDDGPEVQFTTLADRATKKRGMHLPGVGHHGRNVGRRNGRGMHCNKNATRCLDYAPLLVTCCSKSCVDLQTSRSHCGSCGRLCSGLGKACCRGTCTDLLRNATNCGACGNICPSGVCIKGSCETYGQ